MATDYAMPTRAGDRALRPIVLRAAHSLRHGATGESVLARVRRDYSTVEARVEPAGQTAVRKAVAHELDKWLHAAGWARIRALGELRC